MIAVPAVVLALTSAYASWLCQPRRYYCPTIGKSKSHPTDGRVARSLVAACALLAVPEPIILTRPSHRSRALRVLRMIGIYREGGESLGDWMDRSDVGAVSESTERARDGGTADAQCLRDLGDRLALGVQAAGSLDALRRHHRRATAYAAA